MMPVSMPDFSYFNNQNLSAVSTPSGTGEALSPKRDGPAFPARRAGIHSPGPLGHAFISCLALLVRGWSGSPSLGACCGRPG